MTVLHLCASLTQTTRNMTQQLILTPKARQRLYALLAERKLRKARQADIQLELARTNWLQQARPNQLLPTDPADWVYWLILAGRGFGKTRTGAETMRLWNKQGAQYSNLIGATADDARDIMIEGESGILACCPKHDRPVYKRGERKLVWPNGAVSLVFTADEPERLRGKQHEKLWADELAAWRYAEAWDQAMFGLRLGSNPQAIITTTPKPTKIIRELAADEGTVLTTGSTYDNRSNLAPSFFKKIISKYEGTRLGRQELNAEILDDNPNALWKRSIIDDLRLDAVPGGVDLVRIVVGVDPAVTSNEDSDLTGIVVAAKGSDGHFYVLADYSLIETPLGWARKVSYAYEEHNADRCIGEVNNGGDLVERNVRVENPNISYKEVRASRGKSIRAEPVAALYEKGLVHHVGAFGHLEDQMCDFDPLVALKSPDRMDALVWAITELADISMTGLIDHYSRAVKEAAEEESWAKRLMS